MKKISTTLMAIFTVLMIVSFSTPAFAQDVLLDTEISQAVTKLDKNGVEYTRFIIQEERDLNGIKYKTDVVVMAFGTTVEKAKTYAAGDNLRAIAGTNEWKGSLNYNIKAFVN